MSDLLPLILTELKGLRTEVQGVAVDSAVTRRSVENQAEVLFGPDGRSGVVHQGVEHELRLDRLERKLTSEPPPRVQSATETPLPGGMAVRKGVKLLKTIGTILGALGATGAGVAVAGSTIASTTGDKIEQQASVTQTVVEDAATKLKRETQEQQQKDQERYERLEQRIERILTAVGEQGGQESLSGAARRNRLSPRRGAADGGNQ